MTVHYKEHPSAKEIIALQKDDGTWGSSFHSLSVPKGTKELTTEQALRRLWILGYTLEDEVIRKTVKCMEACLRGERKIDNYWEKTHDWELFTMLMLSAWIRIFDSDNVDAVKFSKRWVKIIELAFSNGTYCHNAYLTAYRNAFSSNPKGARELDFSDFYHLVLLKGMLSKETQNYLLDYILTKQNGIYYIYTESSICQLPKVFASKQTSHYLSALEILSEYDGAGEKLSFAIAWLYQYQDLNGQWDLGKQARDGVYFPLSNSWRKAEDRKKDCTYRINGILKKLSGYD